MSDVSEMALIAVRSPLGLVAAALTDVEAAILERDMAVRFQRRTVVAGLEQGAAASACVVLDGALDFLDGEVRLLAQRLPPTPHGGLQEAYAYARRALDDGQLDDAQQPVGLAGPLDSFLSVESKLLQLAGLSEILADRHVRGAVEAFRNEDWSYDLSSHSYHEAVMKRLARGRDAVCTYADELDARDATANLAKGSRKRMRLVARVLGGVLITGTNAAAALLLGPIAAAASTTIGAAASSLIEIKLEQSDE